MPCNALTSAQLEVDLYCELERRSSQELGGGNIVLPCYTGRQLHTSEPLRHVEWWYMGLARTTDRRACHSLHGYISEARRRRSTVEPRGTTMKQALLGDFQFTPYK